MSCHQFNTEHAEKFGVNSAILLHNLIFWIDHNKRNKKHFHDGHFWTYNSLTAWAKLFPYLSKKQVRTALELLRNEGVIIVGNFNENPKEQTLWYALTDEVTYLPKEGTVRDSRGQDRAPEGNSLIGTDSKPYNKPDSPSPLPPSGDGRVRDEDVFENENNTNTGDGGEAAAREGSIEERIIRFSNSVRDNGGTIYTPLMLDNFIEYWTEQEVEAPNRKRKHPRLKFEAEGFFHINRRLKLWAKNNYDNIQCYLSVESSKLMSEKKVSFKKQLEPFLPRYGKDMLNAFYQHWSQPENSPEPRRLAWECEDFWDLANRLASRQSWGNKPKH